MNKMMICLALAATTLTGCFTLTGGIVGSQIKTTDTTRYPDGSRVVTTSNSAVPGIVLGVALDVLTIAALSYGASQVDNFHPYGCGGYGHGDTGSCN